MYRAYLAMVDGNISRGRFVRWGLRTQPLHCEEGRSENSMIALSLNRTTRQLYIYTVLPGTLYCS